MKVKFCCSVLCLIALLIGSAGADSVMIDDFSESATSTKTSTGNQEEWVDNTSTVPGGVRDGSVGCEWSDADGTTRMQIGDGLFKIDTNKKAAPSMYLSYDGTAGWGTDKDSSPFNGKFATALDLTGDGSNDRFSILFAYADGMSATTNYFNDVLISVQIADEFHQHDATGAANVWINDNYATLNQETPVAFEVLFSELGSGLDMSSVEAIHLHICSENRDMDYAIDQFEAVPEPSGVLMVSAVLLTGLWIRRRFVD
jgi:hypothetical protein